MINICASVENIDDIDQIHLSSEGKPDRTGLKIEWKRLGV